MRTALRTLASIILVACFLPVNANGDDHHPPLAPRSAAFEQMKKLIGHWEGTSPDDKGKEEKVSVDYKLTSGGSVIVETLFAGTPSEMVSTYFDQDGKLVMTHYCALGNQPTMALNKSTPQELDFEFVPSKGINEKVDMHMNSVKLIQPSNDKLVSTWTSKHGGIEQHTKVFTVSRTAKP